MTQLLGTTTLNADQKLDEQRLQPACCRRGPRSRTEKARPA